MTPAERTLLLLVAKALLTVQGSSGQGEWIGLRPSEKEDLLIAINNVEGGNINRPWTPSGRLPSMPR